MTVKEAIDGRISRRSFIKNRPLEEEHIKKLSDVIQYYNDISGLHMQLLTGEPAAFSTKRRTLFFFSNVTSYMCLAGQPENEEKAGYYGEKIVLICRSLGIDTCWVGGTYDRGRCPCSLEQGEMLYGVIALGYAESTMTRKERFIRTFTKLLNQLSAKLKNSEHEIYKAGQDAPLWFMSGVDAAERAPSAFDKKPVLFVWDGDDASAFIPDRETSTVLDLGIAKLHFELGAGGGTWEYGSGGHFLPISAPQISGLQAQ